MAKNDKTQEQPAQEQPQVTDTPAMDQSTALTMITGDVRVALQQMPVTQRIKFLSKVSEYVGAPSTKINDMLNVPIRICGILIHMGTVNAGEYMDPETGEMRTVYRQEERTVFKSEGTNYAFMAKSIASYARDFLIPAFGVGDWIGEDGEPLWVTIKIRQTDSKGGRVYTVQVLE